jgi:hypothetical protein
MGELGWLGHHRRPRTDRMRNTVGWMGDGVWFNLTPSLHCVSFSRMNVALLLLGTLLYAVRRIPTRTSTTYSIHPKR